MSGAAASILKSIGIELYGLNDVFLTNTLGAAAKGRHHG
jgi:hypothetical protein